MPRGYFIEVDFMQQINTNRTIPEYMAAQIEQFIHNVGATQLSKSKVGPKKYVKEKNAKKGKWVRRGSK